MLPLPALGLQVHHKALLGRIVLMLGGNLRILEAVVGGLVLTGVLGDGAIPKGRTIVQIRMTTGMRVIGALMRTSSESWLCFSLLG